MSFEMPPDPTSPRRPVVDVSRRGRVLLPTIVVLGVLVIAFLIFTNFYTEWLWFQSVKFTKVFATQFWTKVALFAIFGLLMAAIVAVNVVIAYRVRPPFRGLSLEQQSLDRYRVAIDPHRRKIVIAAAILLGLLAGGSASGEWRQFLLWRNGVAFGRKDPQFGKDIGFFAFDLPFLRFLVGFFFAVVLLSLVGAVVVHYLYGGLRLQTPGDKATPAARAHISVLIGIFVLLKAVSYYLDRFGLAVKDNDLLTGLTYTDVNALLPAKTILSVIALICAGLFIANAFRRTWTLPALGLGLLVLSAVLIGGVYPAIVQQFQVKPSQSQKESPYIKKNIDATRSAYGLSGVQVQEYNANQTPTAGQLAGSAGTIENIRLLDPAVVSPTYRQLQQIRGFYSFPDSLDVDRYNIDGRERDSVVSVRELDLTGVPENQRNWINEHIVYTHGYGFVSAYGNTRQPDGSPALFEYNIPPTGPLTISQPRVYFGEQSPTYSIVGGPSGGTPRELDYPDDSSPNGQRNNTYNGKGGVGVGSLFRKTLFAVKFQEGNILLSNLINSDSKILWDRQPRDRVEKVAPWLTLDGNAYPAVVSGRVVWILDGYTTSNGYPYSHRTTLGQATSDSLTSTKGAVLALEAEKVNYIRNSVKAVVDAYDGSVTLYEWDRNDPVLKTWSKAFPGTVKAYSAISPELMQHFRYPEDLFKVQRELFREYHVTDPQAFYSGQDFWNIPEDPTGRTTTRAKQPPYYLSLQMPGQNAPAFSLTTTFAPNKRQTLAAFMAVNAEPGEDYGTLRVLQLPRNTTIPGPGQVQNNFESDPEVSRQLTLLRSGGSDVVFGNLLTLPVGGGLLYVEPVYVQAATGQSYPLLRKVLVSFADTVGFDDTLAGALNQVFQGNAGAGTQEPTTPAPGKPTPAPGTTTAQQDLTRALSDASAALAEANAALKAGDFAAYGAAQQKLADAITRATKAQAQLVQAQGGTTATASPSPSPSG